LCYVQIGTSQNKVFEKKAAGIANRIDSISTAEKRNLKKELKVIDKKLKKRTLSTEEALAAKRKLASFYAEKINKAVAIEEQKLQTLIKNKVNGTLVLDEAESKKSFLSVFEQEDNYYNDSITGLKVEKRWTSQFVLAFGANIFSNDDSGSLGAGLQDYPMGYGEAGFSFKYRFKKTSNLWNLKLGFSTMIDEIRPEADSDIFVTNGNETALQDSGLNLRRSHLTSVYVALPMHIELDFSKPQFNKKTGQTYLQSQRGFRLGVGGFAAFRIATRQFIRYNDDDGKRITINQRDNFNVNNFNFGPSAYLGYRDVSLYFKYNINPIFRNNPADTNSLSVALRFDFN